MSVRGDRGRGRGNGRGRGRGRGKTMVWAWETYKPSPAVLDNIWHIRQAPVAVTPTVPSACPVANARTRILERRQTDDGVGRNVYFVAIEDGSTGDTDVERVDVSRILDYVSPRELERFENEQFRVEAEAQAVADRADAEEQVRRRMAKNARMATAAAAAATTSSLTTLDALGIDPDLQTATASLRGRPRGRGRGRPRGRGRGTWRGRGGLVANSALPLSLSLSRSLPETPTPPDMDETGLASGRSQSPGAEVEDAHRSKRQRTASMTPQTHQHRRESMENMTPQPSSDSMVMPHHTLMFPPSSQLEESRSEQSSTDDATPHQPRHSATPHTNTHSMLQPPTVALDPSDNSSDEDDDAEEYVVEAIIEHYHDEHGRKFYLVKWEGYEDSHDWLPEEDLEGAAQLVHEYNSTR